MQSDNELSESDIINYWPVVEKADKAELDAFIQHKVFSCKHYTDMESGNVMDATWVRRWKLSDGQWIVKSRLCGRGFLDSQKSVIQRHSSTASRLSQRIALSLGMQEDNMIMESWDVSNAFLQGLTFDMLQSKAKQFGMEPLAEQRQIYLSPPANVWRHFRNHPNSKIKISSANVPFFVLLLLKPMYGLIDAPLMWQVALSSFIKSDLHGIRSCYDENFYVWHDNKGQLSMVWTTHVDDIFAVFKNCLLYTSPSPRDGLLSRMPSSA